MNVSGIEWTDVTWNPVTGCTKVSPGCAHCYAERGTLRFKRGPAFLPGVTEIQLHHDRLEQPLRWRKPRRVFICSMSDLFHEQVPDSYIERVLKVCAATPQHTYQILTKRAERMKDFAAWYGGFPPNVWAGVSVENQVFADRRIPDLLATPAQVRFLSCEPLLRPLALAPYLPGIQWVIVGGESGPRARPMEPDWVRTIRGDCSRAGVPFFFKQWGGRSPKAGGRELDGQLYSEFPEE